jgi:hypothetical protein
LTDGLLSKVQMRVACLRDQHCEVTVSTPPQHGAVVPPSATTSAASFSFFST